MSGRSAAVDPGDAQRVARHILSGRQFRPAPTPRPFRRQLNWIGDRLHPIVAWIGRVFSDVAGTWLLVPALLVIAAAVALVVSRVRARRATPSTRRGSHQRTEDDSEDPDELERAADGAERAGQLDRALRLRFRAGLLRLGDRGAIRYRPSMTTSEVRAVLGSDTFDELAHTFEAVAYGGRDAAGPDLEAARREWPRIVAGASKRTGS
ncbi:MAG: DUF4129 domain-containing protein [Acidimicrobiia bacterium]